MFLTPLNAGSLVLAEESKRTFMAHPYYTDSPANNLHARTIERLPVILNLDVSRVLLAARAFQGADL